MNGLPLTHKAVACGKLTAYLPQSYKNKAVACGKLTAYLPTSHQNKAVACLRAFSNSPKQARGFSKNYLNLNDNDKLNRKAPQKIAVLTIRLGGILIVSNIFLIAACGYDCPVIATKISQTLRRLARGIYFFGVFHSKPYWRKD